MPVSSRQRDDWLAVMSISAPERPDQESSAFPRHYWLFFGLGLGFVATLFVGLVVLIAGGPEPDTSPDPAAGTAASQPEDGSGQTAVLGSSEVSVIGTEFAFDPDELILAPGATITLDNQGLVIHNMEIEGVAGFLIEAQAGQSASGTIDVDPGEYVIFCSIPGHREAGMEGTLTVTTG